MLDETKATLDELVIELHDQARSIVDPVRSLEIRMVADEISSIIKTATQGNRHVQETV